jgi:hypothetical protein
MKENINPRPLVLAAIIIAAGMFRLATSSGPLAHFASFTPLGAMALFSGCYFSERWKSYLVPLLTLWLTDIILNRFIYFGEWVFFYNGFAWVYSSFAFMVFIGSQIRLVTVRNVIIAATAAALSHWTISDIGVWLSGGCFPSYDSYTPTLDTLVMTYRLALPLMYKMLTGNLIYSFVLFGGFELMQRKFPILRSQLTNP